MLEHLNGETPDNKHLRFYSFAVSGELEIINDLTVYYKEYYFRAIELTSGYWVWCYWKSREDFKVPLYTFLHITSSKIKYYYY